MSTISQILGQVSEDIPPAPIARTRPATALRKGPPEDKTSKKLTDKARNASIVASIIGMTESEEIVENDNEAIIPSNAKRVDSFATAQIPGMKETSTLDATSPSEPATSVSGRAGEELISPASALVAPDITPCVFEPIDPARVPAPPKPQAAPPGAPTVTAAPPAANGALDTILGRQGAAPNFMPNFAAESFDAKSKAAAAIVPASSGGSAMPLHQEGDGRTVYDVTRHLLG